jgi:uncharacterized protein (DUF1800 family)
MKRTLAGLALALAVAGLGAAGPGCASLTNDNGGVLEQTLADEKALFGLEAGLFAANSAANAALTSGLLAAGSPQAVQVANALNTAKAAVDTARVAYRAGDASTTAARVAEAQALVGAAWNLIPKRS